MSGSSGGSSAPCSRARRARRRTARRYSAESFICPPGSGERNPTQPAIRRLPPARPSQLVNQARSPSVASSPPQSVRRRQVQRHSQEARQGRENRRRMWTRWSERRTRIPTFFVPVAMFQASPGPDPFPVQFSCAAWSDEVAPGASPPAPARVSSLPGVKAGTRSPRRVRRRSSAGWSLGRLSGAEDCLEDRLQRGHARGCAAA